MITQIPVLGDLIYDDLEWGFRETRCVRADIFSDAAVAPLHLYLTVPRDFPKHSATRWRASVELSSPHSSRLSDSAVCVPRGRHRPHFPMLGIELATPSSFIGGRRLHLILQDPPDVDAQLYVNACPADVFAIEVFAYDLVQRLSDLYLGARVVDVTLDDGQRLTRTRGLVVEDLDTVAHRVGRPRDTGETGRIAIKDLQNIRAAALLAGNLDYALDVDDEGNLVEHNCRLVVTAGHLVPIPFDFQYSLLSVPGYARNRPWDLHTHTDVAKATLDALFPEPEHAVALRQLLDVLASTRERPPLCTMTAWLKDRVAHYLTTLEQAMTRRLS